MEKQVYALTFLYEGHENSYPYAMTLSVSDDKEKLIAELDRYVEEDTADDEEDIWNEDCNFKVNEKWVSDNYVGVILQHKTKIDLYQKYTIRKVDVL